MKKYFLLLFLNLFFINSSFAENFSLNPKPWVYEKPIRVEIKSSENILKTFWTKNPDSFLDETFKYEKKINISSTTDLMYFGLLWDYKSTKYFLSKYFIKLNPGKFWYNLKLSKIYPMKDIIEVKNEWKNEISIHNWKITTLNDEKTFWFLRLQPWKTKIIKIKVWNFLDIIRLKDPYLRTKNKFIFNETEKIKEFYFEKIIWKNIFKIINF